MVRLNLKYLLEFGGHTAHFLVLVLPCLPLCPQLVLHAFKPLIDVCDRLMTKFNKNLPTIYRTQASFFF